MGKGISCKCSACGYEFSGLVGVGMTLPKIYAETKEKMQKGELGEDLKEILTEHPNAKIDCSYVILRCEKCHALECDMDLSLYEQKETKSEISWLEEMNNNPNFRLIHKYDHHCHHCQTKMQTFNEKQILQEAKEGKLLCPKCGKPFRFPNEVINDFLWN